MGTCRRLPTLSWKDSYVFWRFSARLIRIEPDVTRGLQDHESSTACRAKSQFPMEWSDEFTLCDRIGSWGGGAHGCAVHGDDVDSIIASGLCVGRFEFPYMARRRTTGKKAWPDRLPILCEAWRQAVEGIDCSRLIVGGKSMGGRVASIIADEISAAGLVCLGYPFHPPGKPEKVRTEHLGGLRTPSLFCQGERDTFGSQDEVVGYVLSPAIRLEWLGDGDHGFKPRQKSGRTLEQNLAQTAVAVSDFVHSLGAP